MTAPTDQGLFEEARLRTIARELAMSILEPATIFKMHGVTETEWQRISAMPQFVAMMKEELSIWNSTMSMRERVDVKTLSMIENALPQMYRYLHDDKFSDTAKVNLFIALQKGVGIGMKELTSNGNPGEKIQITINMGQDKQLTIEHTPQVIEHGEDGDGEGR